MRLILVLYTSMFDILTFIVEIERDGILVNSFSNLTLVFFVCEEFLYFFNIIYFLYWFLVLIFGITSLRLKNYSAFIISHINIYFKKYSSNGNFAIAMFAIFWSSSSNVNTSSGFISRKISRQYSFKKRFVVSPSSLSPLYKFSKRIISLKEAINFQLNFLHPLTDQNYLSILNATFISSVCIYVFPPIFAGFPVNLRCISGLTLICRVVWVEFFVPFCMKVYLTLTYGKISPSSTSNRYH